MEKKEMNILIFNIFIVKQSTCFVVFIKQIIIAIAVININTYFD